jgi:glutathione S-transferase
LKNFFGGSNSLGGAKTPEMLAKNPNGKLPILEDGDFVQWESNAMLGYIAAKADRTDRIRVIDHFTTPSSHAAFFAEGLERRRS